MNSRGGKSGGLHESTKDARYSGRGIRGRRKDALLTVGVCTHNRATSLERTLRSLCSLEPRRPFEILVVDNCSTDDTRKVVKGFSATGTDIRYVHESKTGVSHARNRAVREARGEILAFMDDDQTVHPDWADGVLAAFDDPGIDVILTRLYVIGPHGRGLSDRALRFPEKDYGTEPFPIAWETRNMYTFSTGASAYRLNVLRAAGGFRRDLGPVGRRQFGGEDTEMYERLLRLGKTITYWPHAVVYHHIPFERTTWSYALQKAFDRGVSRARLDEQRIERVVLGIPPFCIRQLWKAVCRLEHELKRGKRHAFIALQGLLGELGASWAYCREAGQKTNPRRY